MLLTRIYSFLVQKGAVILGVLESCTFVLEAAPGLEEKCCFFY